MNDIVIVCGYGCHLTPELEEYLDRIVKFCNEKKPHSLILCGGFTQRKSAPKMSEARLMREYILPKLLKSTPEYIFLEEESYTTPENIRNAARTCRVVGLYENTRLTVFCEATRALKVDMLARHFLGRRADIETATWELMSPEKQIVSTLYDWAAIKFPLLARYFHNKRLRRAEQI